MAKLVCDFWETNFPSMHLPLKWWPGEPKAYPAPATKYGVILQKYGVILLKAEKPNKPCEILDWILHLQFGWVGANFFHLLDMRINLSTYIY